jgi:hypothetical protein
MDARSVSEPSLLVLHPETYSDAVVWAHFLGAVPFETLSEAREGWRGHKQAVYIQWAPAIPFQGPAGAPEPKRRVKLLCFGTNDAVLTRLDQIWARPGSLWAQEILEDPYLLLVVVYECWYETLDKSAWEVVDMASAAEKVRGSMPCLGTPISDTPLRKSFGKPGSPIVVVTTSKATARLWIFTGLTRLPRASFTSKSRWKRLFVLSRLRYSTTEACPA